MKAPAVLAAALLLSAAQAPDPHLPTPTYDTVPPTLPASMQNGVLIFSKTNGWRHVEHLPRSNQVIANIAAAQGRSSYHTENAAIFNPAQLRRFSVIVLNSSSGDLWTPAQRRAFTKWISAGGGVVALHAAGGDPSYRWRFYVERIIGAQFIGHPEGADHIQRATVRAERPDHPVMTGLPSSWTATDEWYSFAKPARVPGTTVLATLDEATYRPGKLAMGDHPIIWTRRLGRGRILYAAPGHVPEAYDDSNHRRLIANAIRWVRQAAFAHPRTRVKTAI